uniref:Tetraspanin n=1 Tax=Scylla olivacea TaxID=85551 RepID=A0A0P4W5W5_SCYOL
MCWRVCGHEWSEAARLAGVAVVAAADLVLLLAAVVWALLSLSPGQGALHFLSPWVSRTRLALLRLAALYPVPVLAAGLGTSLTLMADLTVPEWPLRRVAAARGRRLLLVRCLAALLLLPAPLAFQWYERQVEAVAHRGLNLELHRYPYSAPGRAHLHGLQYQLQCCGVYSMEDWYNMDAAQAQYAFLLQTGSAGTLPLTSHVPFSCCRRYMARRCSTKDVRLQVARLMWHERPCINTLGCVPRLRHEAAAFQRYGWLLLLWGLLQLPAPCVPLRLFTTSMQVAAWRAYRRRRANLTKPAAGYLVTAALEAIERRPSQ